jgi:hypothetical protein
MTYTGEIGESFTLQISQLALADFSKYRDTASAFSSNAISPDGYLSAGHAQNALEYLVDELLIDASSTIIFASPMC